MEHHFLNCSVLANDTWPFSNGLWGAAIPVAIVIHLFGIADNFRHAVRCGRPAEEISLTIATTHLYERAKLRLRLDAFGDNFLPEIPRQSDDRLDNGHVFLGVDHRSHEGAVDLDLIVLQLFKMNQ